MGAAQTTYKTIKIIPVDELRGLSIRDQLNQISGPCPALRKPMTQTERILGGLWGSLVGDAFGVPVEFKDRSTVKEDPVVDMRGFGTHGQPPGTWSDDGALILCTVDSLLNSKFDTENMGKRFVEWMYRGLWTATGGIFDVGIATTNAITRITNGTSAEQAGGRD